MIRDRGWLAARAERGARGWRPGPADLDDIEGQVTRREERQTANVPTPAQARIRRGRSPISATAVQRQVPAEAAPPRTRSVEWLLEEDAEAAGILAIAFSTICCHSSGTTATSSQPCLPLLLRIASRPWMCVSSLKSATQSRILRVPSDEERAVFPSAGRGARRIGRRRGQGLRRDGRLRARGLRGRGRGQGRDQAGREHDDEGDHDTPTAWPRGRVGLWIASLGHRQSDLRLHLEPPAAPRNPTRTRACSVCAWPSPRHRPSSCSACHEPA